MGAKTKELKALAANPSNLGVRLMHRLAFEIPPDEVAVIIKDLTKATTTVRTGAETSKEVPDNRTRLAAVQLYLSYMLGQPVQRTEVKTQVIESEEQTLARLLGSPAVREALRRELAQEV